MNVLVNSWTGTRGSGVCQFESSSRSSAVLDGLSRLAEFFEVQEEEVLDAFPAEELEEFSWSWWPAE